MLKKHLLPSFLFFLFSCSSPSLEEKELKLEEKDVLKANSYLQETDSILAEKILISEIEKKLLKAGLVDIQSIDSTIQVDVKYATTDNFTGRVLYKDYHKVYLQPEVAKRLSKAQTALRSIDSSLTLLVFDGARPRSVQQEMWETLDTIPINERVKFVSNPVNGSLHNYGCAVDLTIVNKSSGIPLDMGAGYDDLRKIAYPRHEDKFFKIGKLTPENIENRKLLRKVMSAGGFWVIETEWWHFNAFTRDQAKELFEVVE